MTIRGWRARARGEAGPHVLGQSVVEFALVLPVLILLLMGGLDFGRVFLGWVSLNNTARIAANYAASNAIAMNAGNATALATYNRLVQDDATTTNCTPPSPIPPPTYDPNAGIGGFAVVSVTCRFDLITPVLSGLFGGHVDVGASASFPVRNGIVAGTTGGGGPAPVAAFNASPLSGVAPLNVHFSDASTGTITSYSWDYENDGVIDSTIAAVPDHTYTVPGTYTAVLVVSNGLATSSAQRVITVSAPPGPVANFTINPPSGTAPLSVTLTNTSTGTITAYAWDLDGDGTTDDTTAGPIIRPYAAGTWNVSLTVTDGTNPPSTATRQLVVTAPIPQCTVPNFKNMQSDNNIQGQWSSAGFTTQVVFSPSRPPEYKISKQDQVAGTTLPCGSTVITVFDH